MCAYVIKSWKASNDVVDESQNHVAIEGRKEGLISWILTALGISPTITLAVSAEQVKISEGSLSGAQHRIIPLENICSTGYGYHKPWREALAIFAMGAALAVAASSAGYTLIGLALVAIGVLMGVLYYFLNKTLTLAFVENSGWANALSFKRSVIEGQNIDETSAGYVADLTQALIDNRKSSRTAA